MSNNGRIGVSSALKGEIVRMAGQSIPSAINADATTMIGDTS